MAQLLTKDYLRQLAIEAAAQEAKPIASSLADMQAVVAGERAARAAADRTVQASAQTVSAMKYRVEKLSQQMQELVRRQNDYEQRVDKLLATEAGRVKRELGRHAAKVDRNRQTLAKVLEQFAIAERRNGQ